MAKLDELKQEAKELGIKFSPNISEGKLADKIEEYYQSQETGAGVVIKEDGTVDTEETEAKETKIRTIGELAREAEAKARKTHIVVITDNDQRENNLTSTVPVTCGNDHFDLGLKRIPLNVPVEVEQGFISVLKEIQIPLAVRQMDGSVVTKLRNRYSISYEDELKSE